MCRSWGDTAHQPESTEPAPPLQPYFTVCARGREKFEQGTNHYSAIVVYSPCQREGCLVIYTAVSHAWALLEKRKKPELHHQLVSQSACHTENMATY